MFSTVARVAGGRAAAAAAPHRRCPSCPLTAAAVRPASYQTALHGTCTRARSVVPQPAQRGAGSRPPARLPPCAAKGSDSDLEAEILGGQGFQVRHAALLSTL